MATTVRKKRGKVPPSPQMVSAAASNPLISDAKLKQLYSTMLQCRILEQRVQEVRGFSAKATHLFGGEAAAVGAALDLRPDDWLAPLQSDVLGKFLKGVPLAPIFSEFHLVKPPKGSSANVPSATSLRENYSPFHIVPSAENPASQLNLAAGVALAIQAKNGASIVIAFCGDISASSQRWHQALTFAGRNCLPLVVVVQVKARAKMSGKRKGPFASLITEEHHCGLPVIPVDARDVVAIYRVASESIHKARHGGGPTLIEAIELGEPSDRRSRTTFAGTGSDAVDRMEGYLAAKGLFSPSWKQGLTDAFNREVDSAIALARPKARSKRAQMRHF